MKNTTANPSLEKIWEGNALYGVWNRIFSVNTTLPTTPTVNAGGIICSKVCQIAVPSVTAPVIGMTFRANMLFPSNICIAGLDYLLGTLTVSGNSFADGVTMPTKTVRGTSIQTAADVAFVRVSATLTATTPVLTLTYTNQSGTGSRTATMTLPTNAAVDSCYFIPPHFQTGDSGIYDLTNMSISTGSAGTLQVYGVLPFSKGVTSGVLGYHTDFLSALEVPYMGVSGENIGFYRLGVAAAASECIIHIQGIPEV